MTKQEWFDCKDLETLLKEVKSDRKKRLFSLACCRNIEHLMLDQRSKDCLEKIELFIDGKIDNKEFEIARQAAWSAARAAADSAARAAYAAAYWAAHAAYWAAAAAAAANAIYANTAANTAANAATNAIYANAVVQAANAAANAKQFELLRDIYNPFLLDLKFSEQAVSLAQQVYNGDNKARGILSDYLEEQGYPSEIVAHLKSGFHPKGCWLIDQILNLT